MGVYDTFVSPSDDEGHSTAVQVKFTQVEAGLPVYQVGDKIPLAVYEAVIIGNEGYVVINAGVVVQVGETIYDKWGNLYEPHNLILDSNPIAKALDDLNLTDLEMTSSEEMRKIIEDEEDDRAHLNSSNRELRVGDTVMKGLPPVMLTNLEFRSLIAWTKAILRGEDDEAQRIFSKMPPKLLELVEE